MSNFNEELAAVIQPYITTFDSISLNSLKVNNVTLSSTISNVQYLDIEEDLSTLFATKANLAGPTFTGTVSGITKSMVGLANCDNTSDVNKAISTATQSALDLKANLAGPTFTGTVSGITKSMVGLANCDNTSDVNKAISTATQSALDLKATITYVDTKTTLTEVQGNYNTFSNHNYFSTYAPTCEVVPSSDYQLTNKKYIDDSISSLINGAPSALNSLNELSSALGNDANYSTTITTALSGKFGLSSNNTATGNNTFSGDDLFSGTNTITGNIIANSITLTPVQLSKIQYCDISSSLTTQLAGKQPTISNINTLTGYVVPVDLTNAQTIVGIKTFSSPPVMSGASITSSTIPNSALASSYLTTSAASSNYCDLSNAQTISGIKTFSSPPVMSGASITSSSIPNSALALSYQPILSNSVSAVVDLLTANRLTEKIVGVSGSSPYTLNYSSGSVFYLSGTQPSSNFTCVLSNIPTSGTNNQYTITLIYNSSTACFCNTVSATDTGSSTIVASGTPKYASGTAPTVSNSSVYIQTFTVLQCFATKYIITSVSTFN